MKRSMYRAWGCLLIACVLSLHGWGQARVTTVGVQFKPMLPAGFFNARDVSTTLNNVEFSTEQRFGYSAGLLIRRGFTNWFSLETGISFVQRNFTLTIDSLATDWSSETTYRFIGYEIPVTGLVYIQLSEQWFMNTALGVSLDMYPSDVLTTTVEDWRHETVRYNWLQVSLLANLGFEFRTEKDGTFYVGGSFHQPFQDMALSKVGLIDSPLTETSMDISGVYLSLDFRYFFHEDPEKRKVKKRKKDK